MSIYYSSEADLCLLCSQLCLLTTFCLPEKNEDWGQSEKWGEGRQRRPNLKLQGGIIESLKWNKKCVPETSLKWGERMRPCTPPGLWAPSGGGGEREGASSGCLYAGSSTDPLVLPRLCCDLCALPPGGPFPALHCSPTVSLSWILWAATGQAGDTGITRPSLRPVSCPHPALLLWCWVNGVPGVHYWDFPCSQFPPFLMVGCAGQLKPFLNFPECGC